MTDEEFSRKVEELCIYFDDLSIRDVVSILEAVKFEIFKNGVRMDE